MLLVVVSEMPLLFRNKTALRRTT